MYNPTIMADKEILPTDEELYGISPEQAKDFLIYQGYLEINWDLIMGTRNRRFGSHETRALIIIARGNCRRHLGEVYEEVRASEGLSEERNDSLET
jgi:hypothetical protein